MDESSFGSVSQWIDQIKHGDELAEHGVWQRYFERLVAFARTRLSAGQRRASDEEDIALSAMGSLYRGAAAGRFDELRDRDGLWRMLVAITCRKAVDKLRHDGRAKRGGGAVRGCSVFGTLEGGELAGFDLVAGPNPTPEFLAEIDEELHGLIQLLPSDALRDIAMLRMEGFSNEEIADRLETSVRSIERKLQIIRESWRAVL